MVFFVTVYSDLIFKPLKISIMKKLLLLLAITTSFNVSFAQTKEQVIAFLSDRTMSFNKNAKVIEVNNLDSVMKSCKKKNISYSHDYFTLYGSKFTKSPIVVGGYSQTIIKDKQVPFVMYKTYHSETNNIVIEVVSGSDAL